MPDYAELIEEAVEMRETILAAAAVGGLFKARMHHGETIDELIEAISTLLKERDALKEEIRSLSRHS
jgi:hypothetical protein